MTTRNTLHLVRVDTHRAMLIDEACADEGGRRIDPNENRGRGPAVRAPRVPRQDRDHLSPFAALAAVVLAIGAAILLVHFGVPA